ncbi:MAG: GGDEF domain-containing protein, partial [Anaerotignum sp.]
AFGSIFLFIHYSEFSQLKNDDNLYRQKVLIETDALTGIYNRYAYIEALNEYQKNEALRQNLVAFSIDINGLKNVNDTMGHSAGDELICGAAQCISEALGAYGKCFRTGGDEFIALLHLEKKQITDVQNALEQAAKNWKGEIVGSLSLSSGYAIAESHPELSIEKIVNLADKMMYANKERYYQQMGLHRHRAAASDGSAPQE